MKARIRMYCYLLILGLAWTGVCVQASKGIRDFHMKKISGAKSLHLKRESYIVIRTDGSGEN